MKNLLMFHGSCGHQEIRELTDEEWEKWTEEKMVQPPVGNPVLYKPRTRVGRKTRMVYIYPMRFFLCSACAWEEIKDEVCPP